MGFHNTGRFVITVAFTCILAGCQTSALGIVDPGLSGPSASLSGKQSASSPAAPPMAAMSRPSSAQAATAFASTPGGSSLTMERAVQQALGWHPGVDEATGKILQSDESIKAAQAEYYPKVNAGLNSGYRSTRSDTWRPRFDVTASQLLYDFGKTASGVDVRRAGKKISQAQLLLTVDNIARDTANAVVEVQRYRELTKLSQSQIDGVKVIAALVKQRTGEGASTMSDQVQADARVESAIVTQSQYQSELDRWQVVLASLLGKGTPNPSPDVPAWLSRSCDVDMPDWTEVPAMLEAEAQKEEAMALLAESKADAYPTISLDAGVGYDLNGIDDYSTDSDRKTEYTVGVKVSSKLYNGGQTTARKHAAAYALQSAEAATRRARLDVQRSLLESKSQIATLGRLKQSLDLRADLMVQTRDLYRDQYLELGTRTLLDLLNAEQELHEARFQSANTTYDLRRLAIGCLYSSGKMRDGFHLNPATLRGSAVAL